jgi:hypothetical protein
LIKLDEGDKLVAMARVDADETPKGAGETAGEAIAEASASEPSVPAQETPPPADDEAGEQTDSEK